MERLGCCKGTPAQASRMNLSGLLLILFTAKTSELELWKAWQSSPSLFGDWCSCMLSVHGFEVCLAA